MNHVFCIRVISSGKFTYNINKNSVDSIFKMLRNITNKSFLIDILFRYIHIDSQVFGLAGKVSIQQVIYQSVLLLFVHLLLVLIMNVKFMLN